MNIDSNKPHIKKGQEKENDFLEELSKLNNELVNLQRSMAKQNSALTKLNEEKNLFLGMAVHDLRNPIGVIKSLSDLLLEDDNQLSEEHRTFVEMISRMSNHMENIVMDMLDLSAIESGIITLHCSEQEINSLIKRNVALNQRLAERKNIQISFNSRLSDKIITIDPDKIEQVLNNIITNAIKFTPSGKSIFVDLFPDNEFITFSVKDEGIGIPESEIKKLFNPSNKKFRRKGTEGEPSTGLGLAITEKIVKAHKGHIKVESKEGEGSVFFISLPAN